MRHSLLLLYVHALSTHRFFAAGHTGAAQGHTLSSLHDVGSCHYVIFFPPPDIKTLNNDHYLFNPVKDLEILLLTAPKM